MAISCLSLHAGNPSVRMEDKLRIREAIEIRNTIGESIWEGISNVPFTILLVAEDYEYLFHHSNPSSDFIFLEEDPITGSSIFYRETVFAPHFEATFPAVNGINCVVIGLPENTQSRSTSRWILTLLHENFHQYQSSHPNHYNATNELDLSGGDETGMWQLNFPFPYEKHHVNKNYTAYASALIDCLSHLDTKDNTKYYHLLKKEREEFRKSVSEKEYTYWKFQLWKEGIARYTEARYLKALTNYEPSKELMKLKDFIPFSELKTHFLNEQMDKISKWKLTEEKRIVVYALGMGEGMIMDRFSPNWQEHYLKQGMNLSLFE